MTDEQFVRRLQQELADPVRWPEVRAVEDAALNAALAANELLVYPHHASEEEPTALRVVVEYLALPPSG